MRGAETEKKREAHCTENSEGKIGRYVAEIGDSEPGALIGEVVILERLSNARDKCERSEKNDGNSYKKN